MQINIFDFRIKEFLKWLGWILFFGLLWFRGCSSNTETPKTVKVIISSESGVFESKKPESKPLEINTSPISEVKKDKVVYVENPLNKKLLAENEKLKADFAELKNDTLRQQLYDKAIELNSFSSRYEDKNMILLINGIVRGEVQELTPSYTLKEREVDAIVKETYLRVLGGGSVGINRDLNQFVYKLDIDFQNRKGDIISAEYLRVNNQDYGMIGFKKSLLNFKR